MSYCKFRFRDWPPDTKVKCLIFRERVNDIAYCAPSRLLFSFGIDKKMIAWNLRTERKPVNIMFIDEVEGVNRQITDSTLHG